MLLTIECRGEDTIEIYGDEEGLAYLIQRLEVVKQHGGHEHLMTPAWGGWELSEQRQGADSVLINQLVLVKKATQAST